MVFGSASGCLRRDDVGEPGHGNFDPLYLEDAAFTPDGFEIETLHHQGEVDLKISAFGSNEGAVRHDPLRQKPVSRTSQGLVSEPELEAGRFCRSPRSQHVIRIRREKQVPILCREKEPGRAGIVIGSCDADQDEPKFRLLQCAEEAGKGIHASANPLRPGVVLAKPTPGALHPGLVASVLVFRERLAASDGAQVLGAQRGRSDLRASRIGTQKSNGPLVGRGSPTLHETMLTRHGPLSGVRARGAADGQLGVRRGESMFVLVRTITYASLFIGLVFVFVPARLLSRVGVTSPSVIGLPQAAGILVAGAGVSLALWCVLSFALLGKGTPAPFDPPRRLVTRGPYKFVRNPMYLGAAAALSGAALFYGSLALAGFAAAFLLMAHAFVSYEEPTLRATFGAEYDAYCKGVRRWRPRW